MEEVVRDLLAIIAALPDRAEIPQRDLTKRRMDFGGGGGGGGGGQAVQGLHF